MTFLYPLGLLGLIAIPVLILIYILKNKHTEIVVSSTYLWTLSERFLKKKNPISRIAGIISLILQCLAVAAISFAIARPVFVLPNAADDYVFVLDASGSMHYLQDESTRFELAKEEIKNLIEDSANGSSYTLINVGESTGVAFENVTEKAHALSLLEEVELSSTVPNFADACGFAQEYFTNNPASKVYLVTDKAYESLQNVELINVSSKQENYAISDLQYRIQSDKLIATGKAVSYESDATLNIVLNVVREGNVISKQQSLSVEKLTETDFEFEVEGTAFESLGARITNEDGLALDNESIVYSVNTNNQSSVLIVSDDPFFLQTAMYTLVGKEAVQTVETQAYDPAQDNYQLYIFEGYSPKVLPEHGAVWFVNPQGNVEKTGFNVQEKDVGLPEPSQLHYSTSTSTRIKELLRDTNGDKIFIKQYVKCSLYRNFHTLLSYEGNPIVFAGTNAYDNREVVFAFDFHASDFILSFDYMALMRNLFNYTFPEIVSKTAYYCGESVPINVLTNSSSIRVDTPSGEIAYLDTGSDLVEYTLAEVGTYKITQIVDERTQHVYVYGNLPKEERASVVTDTAFVINGTPSEERRDGRYDDLIVLMILLAILFIADWGVYSYEQYQLR